MLTLHQLKNRHAIEISRIVREDLGQKALYQLNVKTLFDAFYTYLSLSDADEEIRNGFLEFCDELIEDKDTPASVEAVICAAVFFNIKNPGVIKKDVLQLCSERNTNIHHVLQFAIIQYTENSSDLINWYAIIQALLLLDADPCFQGLFENNQLARDQWLSHSLNSAFEIVFFRKEISPNNSRMAEDFIKYAPRFANHFRISEELLKQFFSEVQLSVSVSLLMHPCFIWLDRYYPEKIKAHINTSDRWGFGYFENRDSILLTLARSRDFSAIKYLQSRCGLSFFVSLFRVVERQSEDKDLAKAVVDYLKENYFEELHGKMARSLKVFGVTLEKDHAEHLIRTLGRLDQLDVLQEIIPDPEHHASAIFETLFYFNYSYSSGMQRNFCEDPEFKWLEASNPRAIFNWFSNKGNVKEFVEKLPQAKKYLADALNIDFLKFNLIKAEECKDYNSYYLKRARLVLNFIFMQTFPNAKINGVPAVYEKNELIVSEDLSSLIKKLKEILAKPQEATYLFANLYQSVRDILKKNSRDRDLVEHQIYVALSNFLMDELPLSQYVYHEYDVQRQCVPFLMGMRSESSVLNNFSRDPLFSKNPLKLVFNFMGVFGVKDTVFHHDTQEFKREMKRG